MRRQRTLIRLSVVLAALTLAWACGDGDSVTAPVELCVPADASFQAWLNTISSHEGTGVECAPLTDREILKVLYAATDGSGWIDSDNWLTDAALRDWHGVEVDVQGRVTRLRLDENDLTGPIPSELGNLANLTRLYLDDNDLTGPIPSELGNLANLTRLYLDDNDLTGPIPSELGNLANLTRLYLDENDLTGPIPSELGNLANLTRLYLDDNDLTGPIPPELGNLANLTRLRLNENNLTGPIPPELSNLANLTWLYLYGNDLSGPIPSELGNLANLLRLDLAGNGFGGPLPAELGSLGNLELLYLGHNDLEGPVPAEFGALTRLQELVLSGNMAISGTLPANLTSLGSLQLLYTTDTGLCAPSDAGFLEWLQRLPSQRVRLCEGEPAFAYLVQAVQSREFPVPLVAAEEALLRVFVTAARANDQSIPPVRASFYVNGALAHMAEIPGKRGPIPTDVDEGSLAASANGLIPAEVVRPGLEMVIDVDPEGTLDSGLGVARRIPETGRIAVKVRAMPVFDLTLIPFLWSENPDAAIVDLIEAMEVDPKNHEMLQDARTLLPIGSLEVTAHEPVLSSSNHASRLLDQTEAIRAMEGGTGHYMGMMSPRAAGPGGIANISRRSSFSRPQVSTVAHELGHNLNLRHAPCGTGGSDSSFPYPDGSIGAWGYDFRDGGRLVPSTTSDLMSYCRPRWISDHNFSKSLRFRLADESETAAASVVAESATALLLWGGVDSEGKPHLEPAFVVDAPAALPRSGGEYRITGRTATGTQLFSLTFAMPEVADGDGSSSFAFALPVQPGWAGELASITLDGPGGSVTLDDDSDFAMAILRNPRNGQVRGILRDLPPATQAARDAAERSAGPALEVLFSRGIPDASAWRR